MTGEPVDRSLGESIWETLNWPWVHDGIRVLPVLHGRLEFARAVRAHLEHFDPEIVVVEIAEPAEAAWISAVQKLPALHAVRVPLANQEWGWYLAEPTDAMVEATRWALEQGRTLKAGDLVIDQYGAHRDPIPDPAVLTQIGYAPYVRAMLGAQSPGSELDHKRELKLALTALRARAASDRVVLVVGIAHLSGVMQGLQHGAAEPLHRAGLGEASVVGLQTDSLCELLTEPPFFAAAYERFRRGELPCPWVDPYGTPQVAPVVLLQTRQSATVMPAASERQRAIESSDQAAGVDLVARARLAYRLVDHAIELSAACGGTMPTLSARRVLHQFARNLALGAGRLVPDLFELVTAARGAVDDRFARELLSVAGHWPWPAPSAGAVALRARDLGRSTRLVTLRPQLERIARESEWQRWWRDSQATSASSLTICSFEPEDLEIETLGQQLRERGRRTHHRGGERAVPFAASLLDGLDARETLRRMVGDGRIWVREAPPTNVEAGAVVVIFDQDEKRPERFPYRQVWHGEHDNESDLAFYSSDPEPTQIAPGIRRATYGGFLMTWPPRRLGDVWNEPDYAFCRNKAERLLAGALDYSREPIVVYAASKPPRSELLSLARRIARRIVHLPLGSIASDRQRRIRSFHILADRSLRPLARRWIDRI